MKYGDFIFNLHIQFKWLINSERFCQLQFGRQV